MRLVTSNGQRLTAAYKYVYNVDIDIDTGHVNIDTRIAN